MAEDETTLVPLSGWIKQLRAELEAAVTEGSGSAVRFVVGPVELDLEVATTVEANAKGEVKFWVLTLGGGGSASQKATQRIRLTLTPKTAEGDDLEVSQRHRGAIPE